MKITENNIIESLKSGEEQAFRYIYDKYYGYLCAIAKGYLSDNDAAETVVGDVIYNIWEIRKNLNIHTSLRSYLIRSVKNRSINYLQQEYIAKEISIKDSWTTTMTGSITNCQSISTFWQPTTLRRRK